MALEIGHKKNFESMQNAFERGDVALMECKDKRTGEVVAVVCMVNVVGQEYEFVPVAKLFNGNPYDELSPPDPDGGFVDE